MTAIYQNLQKGDDRLNRLDVRNAGELAEVIDDTSQNPGFIAELVFEKFLRIGKRLEFGVGLSTLTHIDQVVEDDTTSL